MGGGKLVITGVDGLSSHVGQDLGVSGWLEITQATVDAFADATGDRQWIHVDPVRALDSPFGGTIAHGLLTLSLGVYFAAEVFEIQGVAAGLNYGYDKVRFPAPLSVGSRLRMRVRLDAAEVVPGGAQFTTVHTFECEGGDKPVCVAEQLSRVFLS